MSACREVALAGNGPTDRTPSRPVVVYVGGEWADDSLGIRDSGGVIDLANGAVYGVAWWPTIGATRLRQ